MEEELLVAGEIYIRERVAGKLTTDVIVKELRKIFYLAFPMMISYVSQHLMGIASMSIVGHLGELELAATALATSLATVTGYSILWGLATGLDTLCGQAYGAGQYKKLGTYTFSAFIPLLLTCLPISLLWIFIDKLLIMIGQDPLIAFETGKFIVWLIPSLFPYSILHLLSRYLMSQSLIMPMLFSSIIILMFHVPTCYALVFWLDLGSAGAALAMGLSYTLNALLLGLYANKSLACQKTRISFSSDVFPNIWEFVLSGIPCAAMVCLSSWSSEIAILLSGLLPNPRLETSVLSISLSIATLHSYVSYSFGSAASIRIANELGAGNAEAARMVVWTTMVPIVGEVTIATAILFSTRSILGYAFGGAKDVVDYVDEITPLVCITVFVETISALLKGAVKGCGQQKIGAYINLGAYYLAGIPMSLVLGFFMHLGGKGLWVGQILGTCMQAILLALVVCLTNWKKQATEARARIYAGVVPDEKPLLS